VSEREWEAGRGRKGQRTGLQLGRKRKKHGLPVREKEKKHGLPVKGFW